MKARKLRSSPALGQPGSASKVDSMYPAVSGAGFAGGHCGQTKTGCGGRGTQAANIRIDARTPRRMWVIYLEILLALALAAFIVWWTWPRKRKDDDQ
jgi:hypothetical protein